VPKTNQQPTPVCPRCDNERIIDRVDGVNLSDGRRDLVPCPKCHASGPYQPEVARKRKAERRLKALREPTLKDSLTVRACYQPHDVTDAEAARALEEYQRLTLAAWPVMGAVA
jgi:hypothetical protein